MTGPEHYREAERLAVAATDQLSTVRTEVVRGGLKSHADIDSAMSTVAFLTALSQAHATLALAAATAIGTGPLDMTGEYGTHS